MIEIKEALSASAAQTDAELERLMSACDEDYRILFDAMRYSALSGGKRIRPFLVLAVCRMLGGSDEAALPFAAAVEMIHTYSLIHDDLPCMDDDELRRGKPTNHRVYGEATALLAGDALLTAAFGAAAGNTAVPPEFARRAVALLSARAGAFGMIGGQVLDMRGEETPHSFELLLKTHEKKTGALISAAAELGALAAGCENGELLAKIRRYAKKVGLTFQIVDDVLDQTGDEAQLGKPTGRDEKEGKTTFLTYMGEAQARQYAAELTADAKEELSGLSGNEALLALADALLTRKS